MEAASSGAKGADAIRAARYGALMQNLYPNNPEKRFRTPEVSGSGKTESAMGGEDFFTGNAGSRRRTS